MSMALRVLTLAGLGLSGSRLELGVQIGGVTLPESVLVFSADFAPAFGDFQIPLVVREAWSSASGGDAYLVPVYAAGDILINGEPISELIVVVNADFAPVAGDFIVPPAIQDAWSSASGGDAYLVPVYAGDV